MKTLTLGEAYSNKDGKYLNIKTGKIITWKDLDNMIHVDMQFAVFHPSDPTDLIPIKKD